MVEGIGQRSGMHHRLDEGSRVDHRVHQRSGMHHWDGVDDWSRHEAMAAGKQCGA